MTTLVTGAAGYLGSYIVDELLAQDKTVVGIDNLAWGREEHISRLSDVDRFTFENIDVTETDLVKDAIDRHNISSILHLAALHFIPAAVKDPSLTVRINTLGTQSMLDAIRDSKVERFAFTSTGDVYSPSEAPHREDEGIGPFNIYGLSKLHGEHLIELAQRETNAKFLVARVFNLYGTRETNPHIVPEIVEQLKAKTSALRLGDLKPRRDMVPVSDAARAIVEALGAVTDPITTVNLATGKAHSMSDVVAALLKYSMTDTRIETDPAKLRPSERMHLEADVSRLKSLIGWTPSADLDAGIQKLIEDEGFNR